MMADDDIYSYTVKLKRGSGDDVQKCKVTAPDIDTLKQRVDAVREKMKRWAEEYAEINPKYRRPITDDQSSLTEAGES
jgi:hypothetical protein